MKGAKHEEIDILSGKILRIKRQNAPSMGPYNIDIETLELTFNHFKDQDRITIKEYDRYLRVDLLRPANNGPTYNTIIQKLRQIARNLE